MILVMVILVMMCLDDIGDDHQCIGGQFPLVQSEMCRLQSLTPNLIKRGINSNLFPSKTFVFDFMILFCSLWLFTQF